MAKAALRLEAVLFVAVTVTSYGFVQQTEAASAECVAREHGVAQVWIAGGVFTMGSSEYYPEESPLKEISVDGFWIDRHEVTNRQFARFVDETGYVTVAERPLDPGDYPGVPAQLLQPGSAVFAAPTKIDGDDAQKQWWHFVPGANWRAPQGPDSNINGFEDHPVVHVTYEDAMAYASWVEGDLPTEAEWEFAARGGLEKKRYEWGDELTPDGEWRANTWQGTFPIDNNVADGHAFTAPVGSFPANGYGLFDMTGNVWEWVADWYYSQHLDTNEMKPMSFDQGPGQAVVPVRVIKGGSFLCAENFCMRYRPAARHSQETTLGTSHIGFRTVARCNR